MLNLKNKIFIKSIFLLLIQVFLATGLVCPEHSSNKDKSSIHIYHKDLRVPMMNRAGSSEWQRIRQAQSEVKFPERERDEFNKGVEKKLDALRQRWESEPETFTTIGTRHTVDEILKKMQDDPGCFIGSGDMSKIAVINYVFTRKIVDKLIPVMIKAADFVLYEYNGFAVRVGGDEICIVLPSDLSMRDVNRIRLETQQILAYFIDGKYSFAKIEDMSGESMDSLNNALKSETNDPLVGAYKDKDGFFIIYDRLSLTNSLAGVLKPGSPMLSLPSPRVRFGIVRSEKGDQDVHANYGRSKEHAEYVLRVARENGLNGATSEMLALAGLDKFKETVSVIERLSSEERTNTVKKYAKLGIALFADDIELYYPAIRKERLYYVLEKMFSAGIGTTILVRGPPDNFYIIKKENDKEIRFTVLNFIYQPYGDLKENVDDAITKGKFTASDLRWRQGGYGFKLLNEFCGYSAGSKVILGINNLLNQTLEKEQPLDVAFADTIEEGVNRELQKENVQAVVRVILNVMPIHMDGKQETYGRAIEDMEYLARLFIPDVPGKIQRTVTDKGNIFQMLEEGEDNRKFKSLVVALRRKERKYFQGILNESYGNPILNSNDMASLHAVRSDEISAVEDMAKRAPEPDSAAIAADGILYSLIQFLKSPESTSDTDVGLSLNKLEAITGSFEQKDIALFKSKMRKLDTKTKARIAYNINRLENDNNVKFTNLRKIFTMPEFYKNDTLAGLSIISDMAAAGFSKEEIASANFGTFQFIGGLVEKSKDYIFKFRKENTEYAVRLKKDFSLELESDGEVSKGNALEQISSPAQSAIQQSL